MILSREIYMKVTFVFCYIFPHVLFSKARSEPFNGGASFTILPNVFVLYSGALILF